MTSPSTSDENKMADSTTTTCHPLKTTEMTSVSQFYTDKCIFITGGTGFMGKVLVEKLVRSCPGIKNIYLLIRPKRGQDVSTRLNELLNAPLFDKLRQDRPTDLNKIVPIVGDITEPELGISTSDQALLCRNVSIVFHSAATVKFDEKLRLSVTINMLGTKRLVQLCHRMLSLEALIHVSTAYCNCDRYEVNEVIYAPPYDPDHIMNLVEWLTEDLIDVMTPSLIGKRPNTYTFTKALTEHMLQKEAGNLPVAIVRPSIVLSSHHEPLSGWVDNWNGPTGIISAVGKGFYRTIICHENKVADLVPVDTVINLMVVAAWRTASQRKDGSDGGRGITVYNCCTGQQKPVTWKVFVETCIEYMIKHPFEGAVWYPTGTLRRNYYTNSAVSLAVHWLPAYVLDGISKIMGKRPIMVRVQDKLGKAVHCLEYFTTQEWQFKDDNVKRLNAILSPADKKVFPFDVNDINWDSYIESYILGVRQFMFKEKLSSLPKARQQMSRLYWIHQLSKILIVLMTWRFLIAKSNKFRNIWYSLTEILVRIARMVPFV